MEENCEKNVGPKRKNVKNKVSEKHKQLANFIKEVHGQLRSESEIYGAEEAWKKHIAQNDRLKTYAESMYQLATEHWGQPKDAAPLTYCRVEWIKNHCKDYFLNGGIKKFDDKEKHLLEKDEESTVKSNISEIKTLIESNISILDVGSCYNPFGTEDQFSVTAIDVAPYSRDVIKCDFLNLKVESKRTFLEDEELLIELPKKSFDTVIFSLFLEYIPCPLQRFLCCEKAYHLLKPGGLLIIATPDSKHEGANTKIINTSWKAVLGKLGFMRIYYEKLPHIHCLVFRKCFYKEVALKRINWNKIPKDDELFSSMKIFIPKDFHIKLKENDQADAKHFKHNDEEVLSFFNELPDTD